MLLTRDVFRESVFARDNHQCVICKAPAVDAHHIMERRLFSDGGYYLDNGASVCEQHHIECEQTTLSCDEVRKAVGIKSPVLPEHMYKDQPYDKWGNPILPNGTRLRGELFDDESIQKILQPVLYLFTNKVKYPRTYHLPWSQGATEDDRIVPNTKHFEGKQIVITEKMDGENTTFYPDYIHARSLEYERHPSRDWVRALHARVAHDIPEGWRVCGENLAALHSVPYDNLETYFMVFSVWNNKNECLSWDETVEWAKLLDLKTVPVLWEGEFNEAEARKIKVNTDTSEGYVVRIRDGFHYKHFGLSVNKWVRINHVSSHGHWSKRHMVPNKLRKV